MLASAYFPVHGLAGHFLVATILQVILSGKYVSCESYCNTASDCIMIQGSTCVDKRCTCETSSDTGLFQPCVMRRSNYGDTCEVDRNCNDRDPNLICQKDLKVCKCRRGLTWDVVSTRCHSLDDENPFMNLGEKFDPTRDIIIPSVILMTLAATAWLCFKLFCNCGKTLRRRRRATDMTRALEEAQIPGVVPSQSTTWVASYRVFGPMNSVDSRNFPPCLLLPAGPPPYEEALKHKVILSSYSAPPGCNQQLADQAQL
ncbi:Hypothetical protein NTJ_11092 [Nesidiocoris tenuis]|nr:Hypothetical protein NTJ_11092 [Nesidiocoris tenuis]